ncbi:hypothetical protein FEM48_Zijuj11G0070200 [Ziziphus jujuba var. spinosa]|uniref:Uncharacterized protein n=1 Tax=Ziziphus jujuba var. spinosa TaxID=714518 RepID=A0A978UHI2_ZIZJJ|nr:hypothetical protein FEM48_Zijuj11G0070200 [Ziziphus jujuba var. spinosa]
MATRSTTDSETTNETGFDSDKARHVLAIVFSIGRLIRPLELASRCTSFSVSFELIHYLCCIPDPPLSLTEDLYSASSSDALKAFADSTANSEGRRNEESTNLMGKKTWK